MGASISLVAVVLSASAALLPEPGAPRDTPSPVIPETDTSTLAPPLHATPGPPSVFDELDDLGELPLSPAELALLEALAATTSTAAGPRTAAQPGQPWPPPEPLRHPLTLVGTGALTEPVARTLAEAFELLPTLGGTPRGARRTELFIEEALLEPLLDPRGPSATSWLGLDPRLLDAAGILVPGSLALGSRGAGGALLLLPKAAPEDPRLHFGATATARSGDRSGGLLLDAAGGVSGATARLQLGFDELGALRIPAEHERASLDTAARRWIASARLRLLGREGDPLRLTAGADLHRIEGLPRLDAAGEVLGVERLSQRHLAFGRIEAGSAERGASLFASHAAESRRINLGSGDLTSASRTLQARLTGHLSPISALTLRAGASALASSLELSGDGEGHRRRFEGFVTAELDTPSLEAALTARLAHQASQLERPGAPARELAATLPLVQGSLHIPLAAGFGLRAGATRGMYVPTPLELGALPEGAAPIERSLTFEAGPSVRAERLWLDLTAFTTRLEDTLEVSTGRLLGPTRVAGAELTGRFTPGRGLLLAAAVTWAEAVEHDGGLDVDVPPSLQAFAALRLELPAARAFLQVHGRAGSDPLRLWSHRAEERALDPSAFVRLGAAGALDLGAGLRLHLALENAFDQRHRLPGAALPAAGVDLRVALSFALPEAP